MNKFISVDLNEDQIKSLKTLEEYTKSFFSNTDIFNESKIIDIKKFERERKHVDSCIFRKSLTYTVGCVQVYETGLLDNNAMYSNFYDVSEDDIDLSIFQNFVNSVQNVVKGCGNELGLDEEDVNITLQLCEYPNSPHIMVSNTEIAGHIFSFNVSRDCRLQYQPHDEWLLSNSGLLVTDGSDYFMQNRRNKTLYVFTIFISLNEDAIIEEPEPEKEDVKLKYRPPWGRPKENEELTDTAQQTSKTKMNKVQMIPDVERVGRKDSQWGVDKYTVRPKRKDDKT